MQSNADEVASVLSAAFLSGALEVEGLVDRGAKLLGRRWTWLRPLARRICAKFGGRTRPRQSDLARFILDDERFLQAANDEALTLIERLSAPPAMAPVAAAEGWELPTIRSPGELADWLGISCSELDWFADLRALEYNRNQGRLRHYHYRPLAKRFGHVRLLEAPKQRLKQIQRYILAAILNHIPTNAAVHGFRRGRSIRSFASLHTGKRVVLRLDLQDFFPSIVAARIQAIFRTAGYPERVADLLAGLCTNSTPLDVWEDVGIPTDALQMQRTRWLYARPHLPQGAPTSPALANLCAYRLDCRLSGLASAAGAIYTRYADDLAFSGDHDFDRVVKRFHVHVAAIAIEEGFTVHFRKTRIMRQGVRQHLAGIVVNERLNVARADFDRLKATLTNCVRHGPQSQNREACENFRAQLLGRISFAESVNPVRGGRLRAIFDRIEW